MKKTILLLIILGMLALGCGRGGETPPATQPPVPSETATPEVLETATASITPTPEIPAGFYGPVDYPQGVNPLTGLRMADPALLERRPMAIKVSNLPRSIRPQWGLSLADIVFEYYTEEGTSRFTAIFYGQDAEMVGPIRSARFIDVHLVRGYEAIFAFAGGYIRVLDRLYASEFADRLVTEGIGRPLFRYDPTFQNNLMVGTAELSAYVTQQGIENGHQDLSGMSFQLDPPDGGQPAEQFVVRYSGAIYNRWQYDAAAGKYLRFADSADDPLGGQGEQYAQSVDRLTGEALAFDNVVVIFVQHDFYINEVWDIQLQGSGTAYLFRDGRLYPLAWQRLTPEAGVSLANPDGTPFPFRPGTTWFEVVGLATAITETDQGYRFVHYMP